jgi:sigma-B regulation protein RsbU (phosphoserine phosphatase)
MIEQLHTSSSPDPNLTVVDKLRMLLDITKRISRSFDLDEILQLVMDTLGSLIQYDAASIYLLTENEDNTQTFQTKALRGYEINELIDPTLKLGEGILGFVVEKKEAVLSNDVSQDSRYVSARAKTKSEMVAPIIANEEVVGAFDLESDQLNAFGQDDLEILQLLAAHVAIIIEKVNLYEHLAEKKRLQGQLEVARQVQLELLPNADPKLTGFDISAFNFATDEVSGDYYDWVNIFDDQIAVVIADASGKGIPAALLMAFLRATLRSAAHTGYAPQISLTKANELLWESTENNQFITAIYGILDAANRIFYYANAGHNPPILLDSENNIEFIERGDLPLGLFPSTQYHQFFQRLRPQHTFVLYTDGLTEATNPAGEEFGRTRLAELIKEGKDLSAADLIKFINQKVLDFTNGAGLDDDGTLFVMKAL